MIRNLPKGSAALLTDGGCLDPALVREALLVRSLPAVLYAFVCVCWKSCCELSLRAQETHAPPACAQPPQARFVRLGGSIEAGEIISFDDRASHFSIELNLDVRAKREAHRAAACCVNDFVP